MKATDEIKKEFLDAEPTEELIKTNDIKKGDIFVETNGWFGEMIDNMKGNIRLANIHGLFTEMGSIYAWDIAQVCKNGKIYDVELTPKQEKDKERCSLFGNMW